MSAYVMDYKNSSNQSGGSINGTFTSPNYPNYYQTEQARVVEVIVDEYFEDGKLVSRTTKTVTRYEPQTTYQPWITF